LPGAITLRNKPLPVKHWNLQLHRDSDETAKSCNIKERNLNDLEGN